VDSDEYLPRIFELLRNNKENEVYTFFQQLRSSPTEPWDWFISSIAVSMRDDENKPLLLSVSLTPINPIQHVTRKVSRMIEESSFKRENQHIFDCLSEREREILNFIANGVSNQEIADRLFLSVNTIETHRKNIKAKLNARTNRELIQFARAFEA
jgi:DNA-binding CsgD family transcriptional regulator